MIKISTKCQDMDYQRTTGLSCERARAFPIEKALAKLGHFPTRTNEKEAWFLSPLRLETQASFKVSKNLNRWYDHGEGTGGNVIDLICRMRNCSVKEALTILEHDQASFFFHRQPSLKKERQDGILVKELAHHALKQYLSSRNISIPTAKKFIKEIHYGSRDKNYFAIGFKNDSGGWELRNKYVKNCSSPKDITHIRNGKNKLIVTEGMFDLLSILETQVTYGDEYDFLVLNSTAFLRKAMNIIEGYNQIDLYLDNDSNGIRTTQKLMAHSTNCLDKSSLYEGFKDMNDWLVKSVKKGLGQEARDVSLLPQRQTRFTPDGCKVKEK